MRIVFLVGAAALALVACNGSVEPTELPDEPAAFAGTKWDLLSLYGTQAIPGTSITLEFMEDRLVGFAGCNNYGAPYTATTLGLFEAVEVERTEIGCLEPEGVLVQEGVFEQALLSAVRYEQTPATLTFFDENGHSVLQFDS
jgi:heat shock protein HslJ